MVCAVAAIAAAAIASGAVPPEEGGDAGLSVDGVAETATGTTATGVGVVPLKASCCAKRRDGSTAVVSVSASACPSSDRDPVVFVVSEDDDGEEVADEDAEDEE